MAKTIIQTDNAPQAIGTYSQAVKVDNTVYISGQIPLDPASMEIVEGEYLAFMRVQVSNQRGVLANLAATIADMSSNIEYINLTEKDGRISTIEFVISVKNRTHLARIMKKLRRLPVVNRIWRK